MNHRRVFFVSGLILALLAELSGHSAFALGKARHQDPSRPTQSSAPPQYSPADPKFLIRIQRHLPKDLAAIVITDLNTLASFTGKTASSLNAKVFGGVALSGMNYLSFFMQRIKRVDQDSCGGPPAAACVYPGSHTMQIAPSYLGGTPQIERISTMIHESRHTEGGNGNWPHVNCPVPFRDKDGTDIRGHDSNMLLEGLAGCDDVLLGAYGVEVIFLKNVSKYCENCTEKIKMDAEIYWDSFKKRIVNPGAAQDLEKD